MLFSIGKANRSQQKGGTMAAPRDNTDEADTCPKCGENGSMMGNGGNSSLCNDDSDGSKTVIYESGTTRILRLRDEGGLGESNAMAGTSESASPPTFVAVKSLKERSPPCEEISSLYNEYNILTRNLSGCKAVRTAFKKSMRDGLHTIYLEWVEGISLQEWIRRNPQKYLQNIRDSSFASTCSSSGSCQTEGKTDGVRGSREKARAQLIRTVELMFEIACALAEIHTARVRHNDFVADNILVIESSSSLSKADSSAGEYCIRCNTRYPNNDNDNKMTVKIIDFGFAEPTAMQECDDEGESTNDDLYQLGLVFRDIFLGGEYAAQTKRQSLASASMVASALTLQAEAELFDGDDEHDDHDYHYDCNYENDHKSANATPSLHSEVGSLHSLPPDFPPYVPQSLQDIISNLMCVGTNALPYDTAEEVKEDLQQILERPDKFLFENPTDPVKDFTLESDRPRKLYGRETQLMELLDAYKRVTQREDESGNDAGAASGGGGGGGQSEMVLVTGYSGTGKSSLVHQLRQPVTERGGYFISGKFDQLQCGEPYSALIVAFTELCTQILRHDDDQAIRRMGREIRKAVGSQGRVLTDVIPILIDIIGEQDDVSYLTGHEAQNRFNFVFRMFARSISSSDHPVVLFLDDLQWADPASLELIKILMTDGENTSLLFVGAYRNNEVHADHPLSVRLREIEKRCAVMSTRIEIGNLSQDAVNCFLSDILCQSRRLTRPLSDLVYRKTHGNAFFVVQFVKSLYGEELLKYSSETRRWMWDEEGIQSKKIADNVVELLAGKILKLSKQTQHVLKLAAGMGSFFDEKTLGLVLSGLADSWHGFRERSSSFGEYDATSDLNEILEMALAEGMISRKSTSGYTFSHDRIQQAAYSLIPKEERGLLHLSIGRLLVKNLKEADQDRMIFVAADQLNRGWEFITDKEEKVILASLNLRAGEKAVASSAFVPAEAYLMAGIDQLDDSKWEENYDITLRLYSGLAETHYCIGHFKGLEGISDEVIKNATKFRDKLKVYSVVIKALGAQGRMKEAIDMGFDVLEQLGEPFPQTATKFVIMKDLLKTKLMLRGKTDDRLFTLPAMENEAKIAAMKMLCLLLAYNYLSRPKFVPLIACRMMQLTLRHGACDESASGFSIYGLLLSGVLGDLKGGYRFGQLAESFLERFDANKWSAQVYTVVYACIKHWREHLKLSIAPLSVSYRVGMETGDIEYAFYSSNNVCIHSYFLGQPLEYLEKQMRSYAKKMANNGQDNPLHMLSSYWQCVLNLMGRSADPVVLTGDAMNQDETLKVARETGNTLGLLSIYLTRLFLAYIFGDYRLAAEMAESSRNVHEVAAGKFEVVEQAFYDGLSSFAMAREKPKEKKWISNARRVTKKMKTWAAHSPENCSHKYLLLKAEERALRGRKSKTVGAFEAAVEAAARNGFIQDEAMIYERFGEHNKRVGDQSMASHCIARAHQLYVVWGAHAKAERVDKQFSTLLKPARQRESFQAFIRGRSSVSPTAV